MKVPIKPIWIIYGVGAGVALLAINAIIGGRLITSAATAVTRAPEDLFYGSADGLFGLPDTRTADSRDKCAAARAAGNDWEASFVCPASSWLRGLFDGN